MNLSGGKRCAEAVKFYKLKKEEVTVTYDDISLGSWNDSRIRGKGKCRVDITE